MPSWTHIPFPTKMPRWLVDLMAMVVESEVAIAPDEVDDGGWASSEGSTWIFANWISRNHAPICKNLDKKIGYSKEHSVQELVLTAKSSWFNLCMPIQMKAIPHIQSKALPRIVWQCRLQHPLLRSHWPSHFGITFTHDKICMWRLGTVGLDYQIITGKRSIWSHRSDLVLKAKLFLPANATLISEKSEKKKVVAHMMAIAIVFRLTHELQRGKTIWNRWGLKLI